MNRRPRIVLLAVATAVVLAFALALILDRPATRSPAGASPTARGTAAATDADSGFEGAPLPGAGSAPDFTLTDQQGRRVSLGQYRGQVVILSFLSTTCPPTCPLIAQQIRGALDELGWSVPVLIVSANPAADTHERVRR